MNFSTPLFWVKIDNKNIHSVVSYHIQGGQQDCKLPTPDQRKQWWKKTIQTLSRPCGWIDSTLNASSRIHWRASLVPPAVIIPAPIATSVKKDLSWILGAGGQLEASHRQSLTHSSWCPLNALTWVSHGSQSVWASLVAQIIKNLPAIWETWVWSPSWEDSHGGGQRNLLQYSCLENPNEQSSLVGYSPWGCKVLYMTEWLSTHTHKYLGFPGGSDGKESTCNAGDWGWVPGSGRSPGGGHGNSLQCSCLKNPHRQTSLEGYSLIELQRVEHNWVTKHSTDSMFYMSVTLKCIKVCFDPLGDCFS